MNKYFLLSFCIPFISFACTPFDSNKNNKKLIRSTWHQVEIVYPNINGDSLIVEHPEGVTILTFTDDSCHERMKDLHASVHYSYDIKDYVLKLEKDSVNINYLDIRKLTSDSLILHSKNRFWKYIKKTD